MCCMFYYNNIVNVHVVKLKNQPVQLFFSVELLWFKGPSGLLLVA